MRLALRDLYRRYAARHANRMGGAELGRYRGKPQGYVERIWRVDGQIRITGWSVAQDLSVRWGAGSLAITPSLPRADVADSLGFDADCGFEINLPVMARDLRIEGRLAYGKNFDVPLLHPSDQPPFRARLRMRRAFLRDLFGALRPGLRYVVSRRAEDAEAVKARLGMAEPVHSVQIEAEYLPRPGHIPAQTRFTVPHDTPVTIIIPVHNAYIHLEELLDRVARHTDLDWSVILVEDASTDARVRPLLNTWVAQRPERARLIELDENLGFVGAVNRGLDACAGLHGPVILLNSDAMVPDAWASRLIAPLVEEASVASVTPLSNDAEIFSVPIMGRSVSLAPGWVDRIDAVAQTLPMPARLPSAPTGVGFCMALSRDWLSHCPHFDSAFGRGYGEEVDWCQRTRALGARHVGMPGLFIEHRGGQSFGGAVKAELVARANALITERYPTYDVEVQSYMARDPLHTSRMALAIALAAQTGQDHVPIFVAHNLGGGADQVLQEDLSALTGIGRAALVLRLGGPARFRLEMHVRGDCLISDADRFEDIKALLDCVPRLEIIYSCGVGDPDPAAVPALFVALRRAGRADRFLARVHDFFMVSPSYCLLGSDGRYRGPVPDDTLDPAHKTVTLGGKTVDLAEWRRRWHDALSHCEEITAFSPSSVKLVRAALPDLDAARFVVRPHALTTPIRALQRPKGPNRTIGCLGNLNQAKGAGVVAELSRVMSRRFVLIGNIDPRFSLSDNAHVHGTYRREEISDLAERYQISVWLMPSIWPETFSFVTHEMLATGLPVIGFDLGGQGEAIAAAPNGFVLPYDPDADAARQILNALDSLDEMDMRGVI